MIDDLIQCEMLCLAGYLVFRCEGRLRPFYNGNNILMDPGWPEVRELRYSARSYNLPACSLKKGERSVTAYRSALLQVFYQITLIALKNTSDVDATCHLQISLKLFRSIYLCLRKVGVKE